MTNAVRRAVRRGVTVKPPWHDLGESRHYALRVMLWLPRDLTGGTRDRRTGTAMVRQQVRLNGKSEADLYAVEYQGRAVGATGFVFAWENLTDRANPGPYLVTVGPGVETCTCRASRCRLNCKHVRASQVIVEKGLLDLSDAQEEGGNGHAA